MELGVGGERLLDDRESRTPCTVGPVSRAIFPSTCSNTHITQGTSGPLNIRKADVGCPGAVRNVLACREAISSGLAQRTAVGSV